MGVGGPWPRLVVVAIDTNCSSYAETRGQIGNATETPLQGRVVPACPYPHVERWYLADLEGFHSVVGSAPSVPSGKCDQDFYKKLLAGAVMEAGHPATLGGIEFAREIAEAMDFHQAGKADRGLWHFLRDLRAGLKRI
jgi:hypothetical protein